MDFSNEIRNAVESIRKGGVIVYPTDTIWGIGCDATNKNAVEKIFALKKREQNKSLIVLVYDELMMERYVNEIPAIAYQLLEYTETPLTIVYPKGVGLADGVTAEDGSIAIRIPKEGFCRDLLKVLKKPLVSTSANFSGEKTSGRFSDIPRGILDKVDYVVNLPVLENKTSAPSSIIQLGLGGEVKIIRK